MELIDDSEFVQQLINTLKDASLVAEHVRKTQISMHNLTKQDSSPVTVADFCCQMIINKFLAQEQDLRSLPCFRVVSEEDSSVLLEDLELANKCVSILSEVLNWTFERGLQSVRELIDFGKNSTNQSNSYWVIDPIDGTKGFLRGGHYSICIGYLHEGIPVFGALACPFTQTGIIQWAIKGKGAFQIPLFGECSMISPMKIHTNPPMGGILSEAALVKSFETAHSNNEFLSRILQAINALTPPIPMDSQSKYAVLGNGTAQVYIRYPQKKYREKIWDHAPGFVILKEAGGVSSDFLGNELVFSGSEVIVNYGIICSANLQIHQEILKVVKALLEGE